MRKIIEWIFVNLTFQCQLDGMYYSILIHKKYKYHTTKEAIKLWFPIMKRLIYRGHTLSYQLKAIIIWFLIYSIPVLLIVL